VTPIPTFAVAGQAETLLCCSNHATDPVTWHVEKVGKEEKITIFLGGFIIDSFKPRFFVLATSTGCYHLKIHNITFQDAGNYTCTDEDGFATGEGRVASAEFVVIGKYLFIEFCSVTSV